VGAEQLSIGRFAQRSGLTVKALRYYDRIGLLKPAEVDETTNFRSYTPDQLGRAVLIARLRSIDVPLEEIRLAVENSDPAAAAEKLLLHHRVRLEARATRIAGYLHHLLHYLNEGIATDMSQTKTISDLIDEETERQLARGLFNGVWTLLETEDRTRNQDDEMLHMAHASRYHWGRVGKVENLARGEWQCSRVYAVLGRPEPALHHAQRVLDICEENGLGDFDLAFAYEALARAHAVAGSPDATRHMTERALAACEDISNPGDRDILLADLETIPGQVRFW
jgi:DNA-binding transcriptional MerR regulator